MTVFSNKLETTVIPAQAGIQFGATKIQTSTSSFEALIIDTCLTQV